MTRVGVTAHTRTTKMHDTFESVCRYQLAIYHNAEQIVKTQDKISLLPRRCNISGKYLWFRRATKLTRQYDALSSLLQNSSRETIWVDSRAYTLFLLEIA